MKITMQFERLIAAVSLRIAWLISRAWAPTWASPISPSSSAFGRQRRDRVDDDDRDRAGADQRLGDLQRLLAGVGLGDQELVDVDAELLGVDRVERVLGVDEGADAALALLLGDDVQRERGLARALGPVDLDDPALGQAADAERDVEADRAGRDRLDVERGRRAEPHDRALAEAALDLRQRGFERLLLVHAASFGEIHHGRVHLAPLIPQLSDRGNRGLPFTPCSPRHHGGKTGTLQGEFASRLSFSRRSLSLGKPEARVPAAVIGPRPPPVVGRYSLAYRRRTP